MFNNMPSGDWWQTKLNRKINKKFDFTTEKKMKIALKWGAEIHQN